MSLPASRPYGVALGSARLAWAAALLVAPRAVLARTGSGDDRRVIDVARVLGARHAVQGLAEVTCWPRGRRAGQVVDVLHSLSLVGLAAVDHRRRRLALADAALAAGWAAAGGG